LEPVTLLGAVGGVLSILNWLVHLAGAVVALVLYIRRRSTAAFLALIGFGLPVLYMPVAFGARYVVADRGGIEALIAVNACSGVLGLLAGVMLVVAFWMALNRD